MSQSYQVVIVGSGPGGLSAAARAAKSGISHLLLESSSKPKYANTIQGYQKGKHVMAEPSVLPLRSDFGFSAGSREDILASWQETLIQLNINIRYGVRFSSIDGRKGQFKLLLDTDEEIQAEHIVLAIGLQGNPRKLGILGENSPRVQYTLDDPKAYRDETIIVVGAGDAAIENAVALSKQNKVIIVNRRNEFARAKDANLELILTAIETGDVQCFYSSTPAQIVDREDHSDAILSLNTASGVTEIQCHRIIARLGAIPQRKFVESCGVKFPSDAANAVPVLSTQYESNVPGLYIVGALGGYPLIKQAMNQGYEVIEYIQGHQIQPADHDLLAAKFENLPFQTEVDDTLVLIRDRLEVFNSINALTLRELMLDSHLVYPKQNEGNRSDP